MQSVVYQEREESVTRTVTEYQLLELRVIEIPNEVEARIASHVCCSEDLFLDFVNLVNDVLFYL